MRCEARGVKSGRDGAEVGALAALLIDELLRIIEAAAAHGLAAEAGVGRIGCRSAGAGGLADLALGQAVADTDDHGQQYTANATYSQ